MKKFILIIVMLFSLCACEGPNAWPKEEFNSANWNATAERERYKFVRDIVSSKKLIGINRREVVEMLGKPSSESDLPNLLYVVKVGGSGFNQVFILDIRFANGKVNQVLVRGD